MSDVSRVEEIFLVALEQAEPDQRAKYLDAACAGDADLRRKVEALLVAQPKLGPFLEPLARNRPVNAQAQTLPLESIWHGDDNSRDPMECSGTTEQVVAAYQEFFSDKQDGHLVADRYTRFLERHGNTEHSIAVYREASIRNNSEPGPDRLSELLLTAKRPDEAIELYRNAIAKNPKDTDLRRKLADLYGNLGDQDARIRVLNDLVTLYLEKIKTDPAPWDDNRLADIYRALGKKDEARKIYREWIKTSSNASSLNWFAMEYAAHFQPKDRDGELAVEAATRACELTGYGDAIILDTLATAYAEIGDFDAAVNWQLKAIEMLDDERRREELENNLKLFREKRTVEVPHD